MCRLLLVALTLNAFAVRAETTEIVGSGLWKGVTITPSCNFTSQWTFNATYANGAYSATQIISNARNENCQDIGPTSCTRTDFFASANDLLTKSQWQAMRHAFYAGCSYIPPIPQSLTFESPDSISGTAIQWDGRSASWQLTRVGSTPTPYALAVIKSGTGSGAVTSSPAGISCGVTCSGKFPAGTSVTLTATADAGSTFAGWIGACTGTGTCKLTMDAAKEVGATFRLVPFAAAATQVIAGTSATITSRITFNQTDVGKPGAVYVTAWVPVGALGALGISAALNSPLSVTSTRDNPKLAGAANTLRLNQGPLAELDAGEFVLVQLTSTGWQLVTDGQLIPYATGVLGDQLAAQTILQNTDTTNLAGAQFCLGYGTSATDMITAGNVQLIATVPESGSTGAAAGTCLITQLPVYRFVNVNTGGHFFTISETEKDDVLKNKTWFRSEGVGFNAYPAQQPGTLPVYRFYNTTGQGYFYTIYESEKDYVIQNLPAFTYEGTAFFAYPTAQPETLPIYRFQNTRASAHFFTIYENEKDTVIQNYDWFLFEGVSYYAYPRQSAN